jgi:hypothetical protein
MSDNYVVCEGFAYWEKDGNYYTTTVKDGVINWAESSRVDIKSSGGCDVTDVHQLYDCLHGIKAAQRKMLNEQRKLAV